MTKKSDKVKNGLSNGFIGGTLSLTLSVVIVKLIGLVYKIPLASILGDEGMGYFNSAYTVFAFFYLLCTAGVPKAVMILISEAKAKGQKLEEGKIIKVAITMFMTLGGVITLLFIVFSAPLASLIGSTKSYATMIAIAPSILFVSLSGVIRGYLSANMKLFDIAVSQIIEGLGKLSVGLVFAMVARRLNLALEIISALTILGVTLGAFFGLLYLLVCSKIKISKETLGQNDKKVREGHIARRLLSISIPITISAAIMSVTNLIDLALIIRSLIEKGYSESTANALYGNYTTLSVPMLNLATAVITPISVAYLPIFTRCCISSDRESLLKTQRSAIELISVMGAPMMIGLIVFSKEILTLLFPRSQTEIGAILLCLVAPSILFSSLLLIVNTLLEANGRVKAPLISMIVGSIVKIIISYYLITKTDMGISGAPIGTTLSYAAALFVSIIIYTVSFKRHIPLFTASILPYFNAALSVMLSRLVFIWLSGRVTEGLALILSVMLAALIYLIISVINGVLAPRKIIEVAKYTKLST